MPKRELLANAAHLGHHVDNQPYMKKILFPTEFSSHAPEEFQFAAELAYRFKANLLAMHAFGKPAMRPITERPIEERIDKVNKKLTEFVSENLPEAYRGAFPVDYFAVNAYPTDGILELALDQEVDLIVLGTAGNSNRLNSVLGSTALSVLAKADCQVLLIPENARFEGIDNIVYTVDFEFRDLEAIHYLKQWSTSLDAPIHGVHIIENDEDELAILKNMMILKETFKQDKKMDFDLRHGHFREEVEKFAESKKADIVAMISHKRNFISRILDSSEVEGMAKRIHLPLLVIKEDAYQLDDRAWQWLEVVKGIA